MKELYKFQLFRRAVFDNPQNLFFIIDTSSSMDTVVASVGKTRFAIQIEQMQEVLSNLYRLKWDNNLKMDVCICAFNGVDYDQQIRREITATGFHILQDWLDTLTTDAGTPFDVPVGLARTYFLDVDRTGYDQYLFFVSDGIPDPTASAATAASANADMINGTGAFAANPVGIHCIGLDMVDDQYLALIDNTSSDGIPSIDETDNDSLYWMINGAIITSSGVLASWYFTSADVQEFYDGNTYSKKAMGRTSIPIKSEVTKNNISVSFSMDDEFARQWTDELEYSLLLLDIIEIDDSESSTIYKGKLLNIKKNPGKFTMVFESNFATLRRIGIKKITQRSCSHTLYDSECGVQKSDYAVSGTITDINSNVLEVVEAGAYADGYFSYGMFRDSGGILYFIARHSGENIVVNKVSTYIADELASEGSVDITLYPGCQKNIDACANKFSNMPNYGGSPAMPYTSPFENSHLI